jgi:hypothetical protein
MPLRLAYARPDGGVSIVVAAPKEYIEKVLGPLSDAQYRAHVIGRSVPAKASFHELPENWAPPDSDRTFRSAWVTDGISITCDMTRARDIHRNNLRKLRAPKLDALDEAYLRADEVGDVQRKRDVAAQKQALRDVTADPMIDAALTPAQLKAAIPAILR